MKKLINILSSISWISLVSLSTISCNKDNNLTFKQQETDVVNAINQKETSNLKENILKKLAITDILPNPTITYDSKKSQITYDIKINQSANTFLNNNYEYRIPEVKGSFNIDIKNNKITNDEYNLNYNVGNYQNYLRNTSNILTGSTNDFTLIMDSQNWEDLENTIWDHSGSTISDVNKELKNLKIYNSNISLTIDNWKTITITLPNILQQNYAACIHVIKQNGNFQIVYTNLTKQDEHNMPLPEEQPWIPLNSFQSDSIQDGSTVSKDNKFITLNKDILYELKDIYTSNQNNEQYGKTNWNSTRITYLLNQDNYCNTNLDYQTIATCIYNNWNIELINNFLAKNYQRTYRDNNGKSVIVPINFLIMQYDQNNKYIRNNLNI